MLSNMKALCVGLLLACLGSPATAALVGSATLDAFSSLVYAHVLQPDVFGDSYTNDGVHSYTPPPVGSQSTDTTTGGRIWPQYIQKYTGINLYDYAVSGAVCDTAFAPSTRSGVKQNQMPSFLQDHAYVGNGSLVDAANETIFAIWIGTNDLGPAAFFTDNRPNLTMVDYVDCVYAQLDTLHGTAGARNFVLLNVAPLNHAPQFALPGDGGVIGSEYWVNEANYSTNVTLVSEKMRQTAALVNTIYSYQTPYEVLIADRYPGSTFTLYDVHSLLDDIWHNPSDYLNGTAPLNVTGSIAACGSACDDASVRDSYLWYDSLHPSEQTGRIIAQEFVKMVSGNGTWSKSWTSSSG